MSEGRPTTHLCGVSRLVTALASSDLDAHITFIRKSLSEGKGAKWIAEQLGVKRSRIYNFRKKNNMVSGRKRSLKIPESKGDGPIASENYHPKRK